MRGRRRARSRASGTRARSSSAARPSSATTPPARRTSCRPAGSPARPGGLGIEAFLKPLQVVTATAEGAAGRAAEVVGPLARVEGLAAARGGGGAHERGARAGQPGRRRLRAVRAGRRRSTRSRSGTASRARPSSSSTRTRRRSRACRRCRSAESMARLNEYPDGTYRELREAAAGTSGLDAENVVVGAGADDLILLLAHDLPRGRDDAPRSTRRPTRCTGSRRR